MIVSDPSIKPLTPVGLDQTPVIVSLHQTTFPLMGLISHTPYVRADLGGHLKYSRRWSGVRAGVLLGAQGAVRRGENGGGL